MTYIGLLIGSISYLVCVCTSSHQENVRLYHSSYCWQAPTEEVRVLKEKLTQAERATALAHHDGKSWIHHQFPLNVWVSVH